MFRLPAFALCLVTTTTLISSSAIAGSAVIQKSEFEVMVTTTASSIRVDAASGCDFENVTYTTNDPINSTIWLTPQGVSGAMPSLSNPGEEGGESSFLFRVEFGDKTVRAYAESGCYWETLTWSCGDRGLCRVSLDERGVRVMGSEKGE